MNSGKMIRVTKDGYAQITLMCARLNAGYTIREVSEKVGKCPSTLRKYESGKVCPDWSVLLKMLDLYNVGVDDIFLPVV